MALFLSSHISVYPGSKICFPKSTSLPKIFPKLVVRTPEELSGIQALSHPSLLPDREERNVSGGKKRGKFGWCFTSYRCPCLQDTLHTLQRPNNRLFYRLVVYLLPFNNHLWWFNLIRGGGSERAAWQAPGSQMRLTPHTVLGGNCFSLDLQASELQRC